jgi:hypothetical protein
VNWRRATIAVKKPTPPISSTRLADDPQISIRQAAKEPASRHQPPNAWPRNSARPVSLSGTTAKRKPYRGRLLSRLCRLPRTPRFRAAANAVLWRPAWNKPLSNRAPPAHCSRTLPSAESTKSPTNAADALGSGPIWPPRSNDGPDPAIGVLRRQRLTRALSRSADPARRNDHLQSLTRSCAPPLPGIDPRTAMPN